MSPKTKAPLYAEVAAKEPNHRHRAMAAWIEANTGEDVDVKTVQLVLSLTKPFRASPEYAAVKDEIAAERQAEKDAARQRRVDAAKARADKLRAALAALEGEIAASEPVTPPRKAAAKKAPAKKAAPTAKPAEPSNVTPLQRAPRKAAAKKAAPVVDSPVLDDDEF